MDELQSDIVYYEGIDNEKIEPTNETIHRLTRTRSDSNSVMIDATEFDNDIEELFHGNQHEIICFDSLYEDFKNDQISMKEFYSGLQSLCITPTAREILEIVKLNCPINKYPEIEEYLDSTAYDVGMSVSSRDKGDAEERRHYEQDLHEQYTLLQTQLQEIDSVAADHQRGLSKDHTIFKALHKVRKNCSQVLREIKQVMRDEECGFTVNRLDEFKAAVDMLTVQLQDKIHACDYLEDDYDPLLDDDSINAMIQKNHDWVVEKIKHEERGNLKKKRFTLFPRSHRSIDIYCQKNEYLMCYWEEDDMSRLLFNAVFIPDGNEKEMQVVPLLIRVSKYCFLFHAIHAGNLILKWNNKLSFRKKKHIHSYVRRFHSHDGKPMFEEYDKRHFDMLDVQSKFLSKLSIEGGVLTIKASSTCQREDGINYITTYEQYNMHASWEVAHTWEEWKDFHSYLEYTLPANLHSLPSFPKTHLLLTTLLVDDRLNGLNRFIQGIMKDESIMKRYEVNKFFKIASHIRRERCAVLCIMQKNDGDNVKERVIEETEENISFSPTEVTLTDPLSYLTSR